VGASGATFLEKQPIERSELSARLAAIHAAEPERRVVLKGDGTVGYEKVRELFERVQAAGFSGVSLMVSKRKGQESEDSSGEP
jgi:biopolymer transport protein ExbD/biopolymer transport protein TolR